MKAPALIEILQAALRNYRHKPLCQRKELDVVTHPVKGQIAVQCKECQTMAVLSEIEKGTLGGETAQESAESESKPRFKI